jgi:hypothetical protein
LAVTAIAVAAVGTTAAAQGHGTGKAPTTKSPSVGTQAPKGGGQSAHGPSSTKTAGGGATTKATGSTHASTSGSAHGGSKKTTTTTASTSTTTSGGSSTTTTGTGTTTTATTTFEPNAISMKISKNPSQLAKVKTMLPGTMTIEEASAGFRNQGQFIAALNASKNQQIDFVQLKEAMTVDGLSLGQAAKQVRNAPAPAPTPQTTETGSTTSVSVSASTGSTTVSGSATTTSGTTTAPAAQ